MNISPISLGAGVPVDVRKLHKRYCIHLGALDIYLEPDTVREIHAAIGACLEAETLARIGVKESEL